MRLKLALLTTAVAFGLGTTAALAEEATGATSDITIVENSGANNVPGTQSEGKNDGDEPGCPVGAGEGCHRQSAERYRRHDRRLGRQRAGRQR